MTHHDHAPAEPSESIVGLLLKFFPGKAEIGAFVGGLAVGVAILGGLVMLGFAIGGQHGITPTF